jgi:tetratricopeptide (TPR) repeat protein
MTNLERTLDTLWDYYNPEKSENSFRALLAKDPEYRAEILTQIARAQSLQGKFDEAHATLDEAEHLTKDARIKVRCLLERGRAFNSANQRDKARPLFLEAYTLASNISADFYTIDAAHMIAIVEPLAEQIAWHEKALELCEATTDERAKKWLGSITNNTAWTYHDLGRFDEALETFQKALTWHEVNGKTDTIRIAKWSVARALRSLQRYQEALEIQRKLLEECETNFIQDGYVCEEIGECLLALKQNSEAKAHFAKAHEYLAQDPWFVKHESTRLERLEHLSKK